MSLYQSTILIRVRYSAGAYVTTRVRGLSASSTSCAGDAVGRLAAKLAQHHFGPASPVCRLVNPDQGPGALSGCGDWVIEEPAQAAPAAPARDCRTCTSRAWSGSGQSYDCNAAAGMPLPDDHHRGVLPGWCPLKPKKEE